MARKRHEKALDILGTEPIDHVLREKALTDLGAAWCNLGDTEKAMDSIHEAQNFAKNTKTGSYYKMLYFLKTQQNVPSKSLSSRM